MTISSENYRKQYSGNDSTTVFPYDFKITADTQLNVIKTSSIGVETTLVLDTDYSVSGVGVEGGGNVTYPISGTALASGETITIRRILPLTQTTDLTNGQAFQAQTLEDALDRAVMITQQLKEETSRSIKIPVTDENSVEIPRSSDRANGMLGFDANGDPIIIPSQDGQQGFRQQGTGAIDRTVTQKLYESVSVKDFGAIGDGVTDDTAAIQAAIDYCSQTEQKLIMPQGSYLVSLTITGKCSIDGHHAVIKPDTSFTGNCIMLIQPATGATADTAYYDISIDGLNLDIDAIHVVHTCNRYSYRFDIINAKIACWIYGRVERAKFEIHAYNCELALKISDLDDDSLTDVTPGTIYAEVYANYCDQFLAHVPVVKGSCNLTAMLQCETQRPASTSAAVVFESKKSNLTLSGTLRALGKNYALHVNQTEDGFYNSCLTLNNLIIESYSWDSTTQPAIFIERIGYLIGSCYIDYTNQGGAIIKRIYRNCDFNLQIGRLSGGIGCEIGDAVSISKCPRNGVLNVNVGYLEDDSLGVKYHNADLIDEAYDDAELHYNNSRDFILNYNTVSEATDSTADTTGKAYLTNLLPRTTHGIKRVLLPSQNIGIAFIDYKSNTRMSLLVESLPYETAFYIPLDRRLFQQGTVRIIRKSNGLYYTDFIYYGSTTTKINGHADHDVLSNTVLTGTTGTSGKLTCSYVRSEARIYIENRKYNPNFTQFYVIINK